MNMENAKKGKTFHKLAYSCDIKKLMSNDQRSKINHTSRPKKKCQSHPGEAHEITISNGEPITPRGIFILPTPRVP